VNKNDMYEMDDICGMEFIIQINMKFLSHFRGGGSLGRRCSNCHIAAMQS
jgi:hypothetical protein